MLLALYRLLGYGVVARLIVPVALFYALANRKLFGAMRPYYRRVGVKDNFFTFIRHIYSFSLSLFDRFSAQNIKENVEVTEFNLDAFERVVREGGIVLLAHVGNWSQSFFIYDRPGLRLNIVMAEAMGENLRQIEADQNPGQTHLNVIDIRKGLEAMTAIGAALADGEIVFMMADRPLDAAKAVCVPFFGKLAPINGGPFHLAAARNIPIMAVTVVREGDRRLSVYCSDPFNADNVSSRRAKVEQLARQYGVFLETVVRKYPLQWFNFYDYWEKRCT